MGTTSDYDQEKCSIVYNPDIELEEIKEKGLSFFLKADNITYSRRFVAGKGYESNEINQVGCTFFLKADNDENIAYISSNQLRWLTHECDNDIKSNVQKAANERICNEKGNNPHKFQMKILLFSDPTKIEETEHIKKLLQCKGVKIGYLESKEEQLLRVSIMGRWLFLSTSSTQENEVFDCVLYEAVNSNSPLLKYFRKRFEEDFEQAKKIVLKSGKITFKENETENLNKKLTNRQVNIMSLLNGFIQTIIQIVKPIK